MSIIGTSTGSPRHLGVARVLDRSSPSRITLMSAEVPPMSMVMTLLAAADCAGPAAADHAAGRAGQQQPDRPRDRVFDRRDAAVRLHDADRRRTPASRSRPLQLLEIERGRGADIGVHRASREALVFADDVHDLGRAADKGVRQHRLTISLAPPLVLVVEEGEQEADRPRRRCRACVNSSAASLHLVLVERRLDLARPAA